MSANRTSQRAVATELAMFARDWQPGQVKTRLAADVGAAQAAELYRQFVQTLLRRLAGTAERTVVCYSPATAEARFQSLDIGHWLLVPQSEGDLGRRLLSYFAHGLKSAERVVVIGSDSPDLPVAFIEQAFDALKTHPVVIGPALDGGYYLIGLSRLVPEVFESMPWSTTTVFEETTRRLHALQIPYHVLPQWYDIDDIAGLNRWLATREN